MNGSLRQDKPHRPNLPDSDPLRCHNCKRHQVIWLGSFWTCTRLTKDATTGDKGCGRMFVPDVYQEQPPT